MSNEARRWVDAVRRHASELGNHLVDEYRAGATDRREFVRRATVVGISPHYGDATFGKSPWLDSTLGITDDGQHLTATDRALAHVETPRNHLDLTRAGFTRQP